MTYVQTLFRMQACPLSNEISNDSMKISSESEPFSMPLDHKILYISIFKIISIYSLQNSVLNLISKYLDIEIIKLYNGIQQLYHQICTKTFI